jgi:hypothetical protein
MGSTFGFVRVLIWSQNFYMFAPVNVSVDGDFVCLEYDVLKVGKDLLTFPKFPSASIRIGYTHRNEATGFSETSV